MWAEEEQGPVPGNLVTDEERTMLLVRVIGLNLLQ